MPLTVEGTSQPQSAAAAYAKLEDRILARDQIGASEVLYDLVRAGQTQKQIIAEAVRIHAPYTHVPYHQRIDEGYPNFVNNDHCLLSARASLDLSKLMPEKLEMLPLAQTVWYIPTGLDIWNQKLNRAPGHYTRGFNGEIRDPPAPVVYWPDQEPLCENMPRAERLGHWLTLVERGEVVPAYRVFLGLMEEPADRQQVLALFPTRRMYAGRIGNHTVEVEQNGIEPVTGDRILALGLPRRSRCISFVHRGILLALACLPHSDRLGLPASRENCGEQSAARPSPASRGNGRALARCGKNVTDGCGFHRPNLRAIPRRSKLD